MSTINVQPPKKILKSYSITYSVEAAEDETSGNEQASSIDLETEFARTNDTTTTFENLTKIRPKWIENDEVADDITFNFTDDDLLAEILTELDDTVWPPAVLNSARINEWRNAEVEEDLFDAIRDGNYEVVKKQLDEDIEKVNMADGEMLTLLHWSIIEGQTKICEYLLENGAKVDVADCNGFTPLHYACKCRHIDLVELLLKWSANVLAASNEHKLPKDLTEDQYIISLLNDQYCK